jgi:hypothetical protein
MARCHEHVGRPALPPDVARERRVNLRLNADEYARIASTAAALGLTPAAYLRRAGLGISASPPPVVPEVNLEKWAELGRALSNLNQLVRELHGGRVPEMGPDILPLLRTVREELHSTREALRGRGAARPTSEDRGSAPARRAPA